MVACPLMISDLLMIWVLRNNHNRGENEATAAYDMKYNNQILVTTNLPLVDFGPLEDFGPLALLGPEQYK
jgi:hypothetical protein